jgi:hypothetical protein
MLSSTFGVSDMSCFGEPDRLETQPGAGHGPRRSHALWPHCRRICRQSSQKDPDRYGPCGEKPDCYDGRDPRAWERTPKRRCRTDALAVAITHATYRHCALICTGNVGRSNKTPLKCINRHFDDRLVSIPAPMPSRELALPEYQNDDDSYKSLIAELTF